MSDLTDIRKEVQQFAEVISQALHVESEIIDEKYEVVGSTSFVFQGERNDWSDSNSKICRHVFESRRPLILSDPGENQLCSDCAEKGCCFYKAGIYYPILSEGRCRGIISLAAFTQAQKERLLENSYSFLGFISKMAEILASKIHERSMQRSLLRTNELLQTTLSAVHEGIIACDGDGIVTCFNDTAQNLLGISGDAIIGAPLSEALPDAALLTALSEKRNLSEYPVRYPGPQGSSRHLISNVSLIRQGENILGGVESFNTDESLFRIAQRLLSSDETPSFSAIIGDSAALQAVKAQGAAVAKSPSTVLITGESGTGKELFARAIHNASLRNQSPFLPVNCGAIPDSLLESELFGYEDGSFTGAKRGGKPGLLELAQGGTVFLNEIGDMPLNLQVKLLRVLQEKTITRIGSITPIPVDVRIIAATNRNLVEKIADGTFREDLYYRLNVIPLHVPPLRERTEDIPLLVNHLCRKYASILGREISSITEEALHLLLAYPWPGNVRELENAIEYGINYTFGGSSITVQSLPPWLHQASCKTSRKTASASGGFPQQKNASDTSFSPGEIIEKERLSALLSEKGTSVPAKKEIAASLRISLATLYRKIKKYGL